MCELCNIADRKKIIFESCNGRVSEEGKRRIGLLVCGRGK